MIIISGRTFNHKPLLRSLGARFDDVRKVWYVDSLSLDDMAILSATVGLVITGEATQPDEWDTPIQVGDDMTYYNYFADQNPIIFCGYSSLSRMLDDVETATPYDQRWDKPWRDDDRVAQHTGTRTLAEAIDLARHGWLGALGMADSLIPPAPIRKRRQTAYAGGSVNVGRMLAGVPNHMRKMRPMISHRNITLFVELASWMETGSNTLIIRAIAVASIVDRLESEGYRCEIIGISTGARNDKKPIQITVKLKEAGERLNLLNLSFALGHPSFGRRLDPVVVYSHAQAFAPTEKRLVTYFRQAFDDDHQPGRNEFYIPATRQAECTDIWEMIAEITPEGLPIEIKRD